MSTKPNPSYLKRIVRTLRYTLAFLLIALLSIRMTNLAEQLAYWPSRKSFTTPNAYQDITFKTPDGLTLHAWFMPAKNIPEGTKAPSILHAHGNAGNIAEHESFSNFLTDAGFNVLLFDYRCYGRSDDQAPINRAYLAIDTQAALDALMALPQVDPTRIGVLGVSLGGPFALHTAANNPQVRAISTVSTFSSWQAVAKDASPLGPFLIKPGLDPIDSVASLTQPYLIIHGQDDQIINFTHALTLYQAVESAKITAALHSYPADHNSLLQTTPKARQALIDFFHSNLTKQ